MNKEIRSRLSKYENALDLALRCDFVRLSKEEFDELAEIYREHFGVALTKTQINCGACKLKAIKRLGEAYFTAPKVGRPRKIKDQE